MSFRLLPVELVDHVAYYLQTTDLVVLSTTNLYFYSIVQRWLYRQITINYSSNNIFVLFTLAQKPHLARHVRTFTIRLSSVFSSFYNLLKTALSNMSGLISLDIFLDHAASWIMRTPNDSTYCRLEHFACSFHLDHHLVHFLQKTHALLELEIDSLPPADVTPSLQPNALPMLSQFTGSPQSARYVVPGRPVESIHLNSGDLTEDVVKSLGHSTAHVLLLVAETTSHSVALIGTLTHYMYHLFHLRIATAFSFSEPPSTSYFVNISNALRSLPNLRTCEIWGTHWVSSQNVVGQTVWASESFNRPDENHLVDINNQSDFYAA